MLTGLGAGIAGVFVGPYVDHATGAGHDILIVLLGLLFGVPAYFFVFDLKKSQLVGLWMFERNLLKRLGACFLGIWSIATVAGIVFFIMH